MQCINVQCNALHLILSWQLSQLTQCNAVMFNAMHCILHWVGSWCSWYMYIMQCSDVQCNALHLILSWHLMQSTQLMQLIQCNAVIYNAMQCILYWVVRPVNSSVRKCFNRLCSLIWHLTFLLGSSAWNGIARHNSTKVNIAVVQCVEC